MIRQSRDLWHNFASTLLPRVPSCRGWSAKRGLDGRRKKRLPDTPLFTATAKQVTLERDKDTLACKTYAEVSRVGISRKDAIKTYVTVRRAAGTTDEDNVDDDFTQLELTERLVNMKPKSPGRDGVNPQMLKRLGETRKAALLILLNRSWKESRVPHSFELAVIIPILKKKKPADKIISYGPLELLACISKTLDSMLCTRLKEWLIENAVMPREQAGVQKRRTTQDVIASICQSMDSLQMKQRLLYVAVDKAAFDKVWIRGLLKDLARNGLKGWCLLWLRS